MNISRRSFLFGGMASLAGAGVLCSTGCNHKIGDKGSGNKDAIKTAVVDNFSNFDFLGSVNPTVSAISWHIFEGLYNINPLNNEIYPALADGEPEKIDDLTYAISIRDNAKFSNDAKIMAGDVVNCFKAAMQKNSISFMLDFIDSVTANGNNKINFKLKRPVDGVFKERLSLVSIYPASSSNVDMQKSPIGSGPYVVTELNGGTGGEISFTPNTNYNGTLGQAKDPMIWAINADGDSRSGAMKGGALAVAEDVPISKIYELRDSDVNVEFAEGFENAFFFIRTTKAPFNKKEVRQAIYYAIDTQRIIDEKLDGHGTSATCFLSKANKNYHKSSTVYTYNPQKARELLNKNGLTTLNINLVFDKNCWAYKFKDLIKENLESVGINCKAIDTEFKRTDTKTKLEENDWDLCLSTIDRSFHGANADFLLNFVYIQSDYMDKLTQYTSSENNKSSQILELMGKAMSATGQEQQKIYNQIFDILSDEVFMYPLIHKEQVTAYDSHKVSGFKNLSLGGLYLIGTNLL